MTALELAVAELEWLTDDAAATLATPDLEPWRVQAINSRLREAMRLCERLAEDEKCKAGQDC